MPTNELYDGPPVSPEDFFSIYVVINGSLGMSPGKVAAQSFHCGWMSNLWSWPAVMEPSHIEAQTKWIAQGRRVVVRIAETEHVFQRVMDECEGVGQRDEGLTEVERGSITAFVTRPYTRANAPKILSHKKVQLL